ncbi:MAG: hypothetical protein V7727_13340 [Sneathiella sp.]
MKKYFQGFFRPKENEIKLPLPGMLGDWVHERIQPILRVASHGIDYQADLEIIRIMLSIIKQQVNVSNMAEINQKGITFQQDLEFAEKSLANIELRLKPLVENHSKRMNLKSEQAEHSRNASLEETLQFSKYIFIGYGIGIVTTLGLIVSDKTPTALGDNLKIVFFILCCGLTFKIFGQIVSFSLDIISQVNNNQTRQPMYKPPSKRFIKTRLFVYFLLSWVLIIFSTTMNLLAVVGIPVALFYFLLSQFPIEHYFLAVQNAFGGLF